MNVCLTTGKRGSVVQWLRGRAEHEADRRGLGESSPFLVEFFMVQGAGFKCMAYRNPDGTWRGAFDNAELPGVIRVVD